MLERNMKPDRMITGSINPIREIIIAVCCELEIVEINIPNERAVIMKSMLSKASKYTPSMGIPKQNAQNHDYGRINHGKEDIGKYFSRITCRGLKGRRAISMVPSSFHG
jgi:hypothetical protein